MIRAGIVRNSDEKWGWHQTRRPPLLSRFRATALADRHVERYQAEGIEHEPRSAVRIVQRRAPGFAVTRRGFVDGPGEGPLASTIPK